MHPSIKLALAVSLAARGVLAQHDHHEMSQEPPRSGGWDFTAHATAFGMFDRQYTLHGDTRWGVLDWEMATATHPVGGGLFRLNAMTSFESFFLPDTGYPQLLQSGETFGGRRIANTQHPHDLFGELSAGYDHSLTSKVSSLLYVAAIGTPALGPIPYRHRPSAAADPFAPLGLHWQDASHASRGVVTAGIAAGSIRLEGSVFNARQSVDENRRDLDFTGARLDSYSGRLTLLPVERVAVSAWAAYLADHDPLDPGIGMQQYGVSVLTQSQGVAGGRWSTSFVWGVNNHHHGARAHDHESTKPMTNMLSSGILLESTLGIGTRTEVFGRAEQVQKMADDLGFLGGNLMETFNIRALSLGAVRDVAASRGATLGVGVRGTLNMLPQTLRYTYTTTHPAGFAVFARLRR